MVLPEGCVTSACAMQSKSVMMMPVEEATLKFRLVPVLYHVLKAILHVSLCLLFPIRATGFLQ